MRKCPYGYGKGLIYFYLYLILGILCHIYFLLSCPVSTHVVDFCISRDAFVKVIVCNLLYYIVLDTML